MEVSQSKNVLKRCPLLKDKLRFAITFFILMTFLSCDGPVEYSSGPNKVQIENLISLAEQVNKQISEEQAENMTTLQYEAALEEVKQRVVLQENDQFQYGFHYESPPFKKNMAFLQKKFRQKELPRHLDIVRQYVDELNLFYSIVDPGSPSQLTSDEIRKLIELMDNYNIQKYAYGKIILPDATVQKIEALLSPVILTTYFMAGDSEELRIGYFKKPEGMPFQDIKTGHPDRSMYELTVFQDRYNPRQRRVSGGKYTGSQYAETGFDTGGGIRLSSDFTDEDSKMVEQILNELVQMYTATPIKKD